jgi:uncharacterized protein (TIGR02246 family)
MKGTLLALGIALAAASAAAAEGGLADLDRAWTRALLADDAAAVGALYATDAVMYPPDGMELKGKEAIQKSYEKLLAGMKIHEVKFMPAKYETRGDTSIGWGRWEIKMTPKGGGDPLLVEGRYTAVAKKIDGKWLYVADHASLPLPPPAPPGAEPTKPAKR